MGSLVNAGGFSPALTRNPFCKHLWRWYLANANVGFGCAIPFRGHRMDVGAFSFILCAVFARFLHNLPHRMNVEALSFIPCRGNAGVAEEVISSQAGSSSYGIPFVCLG